MDHGLALCLSCLFIATIVGMNLSVSNLRNTARIEENLRIRREYKRKKNRRMAKFYGIPYDK